MISRSVPHHMYIPKKEIRGIIKYRTLMYYLILIAILLALSIIEKDNVLTRIQLTVSNVSFAFIYSEGGPLFSSLQVREAQIIHFKDLKIPFSKATISDKDNLSPVNWITTDMGNMLRISPSDTYSRILLGNVVFNELITQKKAKITLSVPENGEKIVKIMIAEFPTSGKISIGDTLEIECQYCALSGTARYPNEQLIFARITNNMPHELEFQSNNNNLTVILDLPEGTGLSEKNIYVDNISFQEGSGQYLRSSLVDSGKIIFRDTDLAEVPINRDDFVKIGESKNLQITQMTFQNKGIDLTVEGEVDDLRTGTKNNLQDQLPSLLEWLYHNNPLSLFFSALLTLVPVLSMLLDNLKKLLNKAKG